MRQRRRGREKTGSVVRCLSTLLSPSSSALSPPTLALLSQLSITLYLYQTSLWAINIHPWTSETWFCLARNVVINNTQRMASMGRGAAWSGLESHFEYISVIRWTAVSSYAKGRKRLSIRVKKVEHLLRILIDTVNCTLCAGGSEIHVT